MDSDTDLDPILNSGKAAEENTLIKP